MTAMVNEQAEADTAAEIERDKTMALVEEAEAMAMVEEVIAEVEEAKEAITLTMMEEEAVVASLYLSEAAERYNGYHNN